jgi:hypothetical protein
MCTSSWDFSGWIRLSRERVCTAVTPVSGLSTYIAHSSGWSNPVWYLSAATIAVGPQSVYWREVMRSVEVHAVRLLDPEWATTL